jgi:hypothetical protein
MACSLEIRTRRPYRSTSDDCRLLARCHAAALVRIERRVNYALIQLNRRRDRRAIGTRAHTADIDRV